MITFLTIHPFDKRMPRQPLLNSTLPSVPTHPPSAQQAYFSIRQGLITIALGSLCLAIAASSSAPSSSYLMQSASSVEVQEETAEPGAETASSKVASDWLPLQRSLHRRSSRLQGMRYVWDQRWLPARTPASTTSFSALDQTWFSWYRWWQLQAVKSRLHHAE